MHLNPLQDSCSLVSVYDPLTDVVDNLKSVRSSSLHQQKHHFKWCAI